MSPSNHERPCPICTIFRASSDSRAAKSAATRAISSGVHWTASLSRAVTIPTDFTGRTSGNDHPASYSSYNASSRGTNRLNGGFGDSEDHDVLVTLFEASQSYLLVTSDDSRSPQRSAWLHSFDELIRLGDTNRPMATPCWMSKTFSSLPPSGARSFFFELPCRSNR